MSFCFIFTFVEERQIQEDRVSEWEPRSQAQYNNLTVNDIHKCWKWKTNLCQILYITWLYKQQILYFIYSKWLKQFVCIKICFHFTFHLLWKFQISWYTNFISTNLFKCIKGPFRRRIKCCHGNHFVCEVIQKILIFST